MGQIDIAYAMIGRYAYDSEHFMKFYGFAEELNYSIIDLLDFAD
jgi:hypothetical protein